VRSAAVGGTDRLGRPTFGMRFPGLARAVSRSPCTAHISVSNHGRPIVGANDQKPLIQTINTPLLEEDKATVAPTDISLIVFACVFAGALLGMFLRVVIPEHHLSADTENVIKLGMGLIATVAALVLGLLIATAKSSYETQDAAIKHTAARVLLLDHMLANYGPETKDARNLLRRTVASRLEAIWPQDRSKRARFDPPAGAAPAAETIESRILQLSPQNDAQRWLQSEALRVGRDIMETRWLVLGGLGSSVPALFLVVVVFWLTIIFASFGLLAPRNATVVTVFFLASLSVAGSIFLILEMDQPFEGLMKVSSDPIRYALTQLGRQTP
jgi:hypothetical protein